MEILFSKYARTEFLSALNFLSRGNSDEGKLFLERVKENLKEVLQFPSMGSVIPEFPRFSYREIDITPYRFFYTVKDEKIWVVAVIHENEREKKLV